MRWRSGRLPVAGAWLVVGAIAVGAERFAGDLKAALGPATTVLEIDMSQVDHIGRTGTPALFDPISAARRAGVRVVVSQPVSRCKPCCTASGWTGSSNTTDRLPSERNKRERLE